MTGPSIVNLLIHFFKLTSHSQFLQLDLPTLKKRPPLHRKSLKSRPETKKKFLGGSAPQPPQFQSKDFSYKGERAKKCAWTETNIPTKIPVIFGFFKNFQFFSLSTNEIYENAKLENCLWSYAWPWFWNLMHKFRTKS